MEPELSVPADCEPVARHCRRRPDAVGALRGASLRNRAGCDRLRSADLPIREEERGQRQGREGGCDAEGRAVTEARDQPSKRRRSRAYARVERRQDGAERRAPPMLRARLRDVGGENRIRVPNPVPNTTADRIRPVRVVARASRTSPAVIRTRHGAKTRRYPKRSPSGPKIGLVTRMTMASVVR